MEEVKQKIIANICYTELVYGRINKKLGSSYSKAQIEVFIQNILTETDELFFTKRGKNYYIVNNKNNIRITINANTYRVITADVINKT